MQNNTLTIRINKPIHEVFTFGITPPNSTRWIPDVVKEETNEWPVAKGTVYTLQTKEGTVSEVTVFDIKTDEFVEWISKDRNYHCKYSFTPINGNVTELEYHEWVDNGDITDPFTAVTLNKLKTVLEKL